MLVAEEEPFLDEKSQHRETTCMLMLRMRRSLVIECVLLLGVRIKLSRPFYPMLAHSPFEGSDVAGQPLAF